ncbi:unnamed protein product [Mytilus coruscus]|uniref:Reverse transcriptase domain-containing protein n=1 Tax=Mytilus coruscus TaxID=42192 RepID=A0A6J8DAN8_MYTCO|nr:unnamed protein product [Mytilus coruscus]
MTTDTHVEASNFYQEPPENQFQDSINGLTRRISQLEGTKQNNSNSWQNNNRRPQLGNTNNRQAKFFICESTSHLCRYCPFFLRYKQENARHDNAGGQQDSKDQDNRNSQSINQGNFRSPLAQPSTYKLFDVNGNPLCSHGTLKQKLTSGKTDFNTEILVCDIKQDAILGQDFLLDHIDKIDYKRQILSTKDTDIQCWIGGEANVICRVIVKETVTLPGKSKLLIPVLIENAEHLEPLRYVDKTQKKETELNITRGILDPRQEDITVQLINFREEPVTIYAKEHLEVCESFYEMPAVGVCNHIETEGTRSDKLPSHIEDLFNIVHLQEKAKATTKGTSSIIFIQLYPDDREKTAFSTSQGLFQLTVTPFGLATSPAVFERLMEDVLRGLQWGECLLYMDDIIVPGATFEEELLRLEHVFQRMSEANLKFKPSKCILFQKSVKFLGHIVSVHGVQSDPEKI